MRPNHSSNNNKNIKFIGQVQEAISFKIDPKAASASESLFPAIAVSVFLSLPPSGKGCGTARYSEEYIIFKPKW